MSGRSSQLVYSPALTPIALEYSNSEHVAERFVDVIPVDLRTDTYFEWQASAHFEVVDDSADEDSTVKEVRHRRKNSTYVVEDHGLREAINNKSDEASARLGFNEKADVTASLLSKISLAHEIRVASILTTTGNHLSSHVLTAGAGASPAKWTNASGDPFKDLGTVFDTLLGVGGASEVRVLFSQTAWRNLSNNANARAAFSPTQLAAVLSPAQVEAHLKTAYSPLIRVMVAGAWKHAGEPTLEESELSLTRVWGDAVVFNVTTTAAGGRPSKATPAGAYTFRQKVRGATRPVYTYEEAGRGAHGSTWVQVASDDVTKIVSKQHMGLIVATS